MENDLEAVHFDSEEDDFFNDDKYHRQYSVDDDLNSMDSKMSGDSSSTMTEDSEAWQNNRRRKRQQRQVPSLTYIYRFLKAIFDCAQFSSECTIISLVYINRLIALTGMHLHASNWRPLMLVALLLSQKVWDDKSLQNSHFSLICPMFTTQEINKLEKKFLELLDFDVGVSSRLYARYYFELRVMAEDANVASFTLKPLNSRDAHRLEERSRLITEKSRSQRDEENRRRSADMYNATVHSRVILKF